MAAGQHVRLDAEPVLGQRPLETDGEEPVVRSGHDPDRYRRPRGEVADRPERGVSLGPLVRLTGRGDLRGDVVEEVDGQVEVRAVATSLRRGGPGLRPPGVVPPCARRSPGLGIIAFTKAIDRNGTFAATSGAVNPPSD